MKIRDCDIRGNSAKMNYGGGIHASDADVYVWGSFVEGNSAGTDGGGILLTGSSGASNIWLVSGSHFVKNSGFRGGAISIENTSHHLTSLIDDVSKVSAPVTEGQGNFKNYFYEILPSENGLICVCLFLGCSVCVNGVLETIPSIKTIPLSRSNSDTVSVVSSLFGLAISNTTYAEIGVFWEDQDAAAETDNFQLSIRELLSGESSMYIADPAFLAVEVPRYAVVSRVSAYVGPDNSQPKPIMTWGINSDVSDKYIVITLLDEILVLNKADIESGFENAISCQDSSGADSYSVKLYTAVAISHDNAHLFISRYDGLSSSNQVSSIWFADLESKNCTKLPWNTDLGLIRAMRASADGLFLYVADNIITRTNNNPFSPWTGGTIEEREDFLVIRIILIESGTVWNVVDKTGPLIFHNIISIRLQLYERFADQSLPSQSIFIYGIACPNKVPASASCPIDDPSARWYVTTVSSVSIQTSNSEFEDNSATISGGAISVQDLLPESGPVQMTNLSFFQNVASLTGGAIAVNSFASVIVMNSQLEQNSVFRPSSGRGGCMGIQYSSLTWILNSTMKGNKAPYAPAVHATSFLLDDLNFQPYWVNPNYEIPNAGSTKIFIVDCIISENEATDPQLGKGAVSVEGTSYCLLNSSFISHNTALFGGGLASSGNCSVLISGSTFVANNVLQIGGAVAITESSTMTVKHSIFMQNAANNGGALAIIDNSFCLLQNTNISGNTASFSGGGVYLDSLANLTIFGSYMIGNKANFGAALYTQGNSWVKLNLVTLTYNEASQCGGALALNSSYPAYFEGGVVIGFNMALAGASGGGICALLRDESGIGCNTALGLYPFMVDAASSDGAPPVIDFINNFASMGGGALFADCIEPGNQTEDLFRAVSYDLDLQQWISADARFAFTSNKAGYGPVIGTLGQRLKLLGNVRSYHAGDYLNNTIVILDCFGQQVSRFEQPLPFTVTVIIDGLSVNNQATFQFSVGGFCHLIEGHFKLPWPSYVASGEVNRTYVSTLSLRHEIIGAISGVFMAPVIVNVSRLPCAAGTSYDKTQLMCISCLSTEYCVDPDQYPCEKCPVGGSCDGSTVSGKGGVDAQWQVEAPYIRLVGCPPGYLLERVESDPVNDQCSMCSAGTYSLEPVQYDPEEAGTVSSIGCLPCPVGAVCQGGADIRALPDYWIKNSSSFRFARRLISHSEKNQRRDSSNPLAQFVFPCPTSGVCLGDNVCRDGHAGIKVRNFIFML